jgi:hypothetical protein
MEPEVRVFNWETRRSTAPTETRSRGLIIIRHKPRLHLTPTGACGLCYARGPACPIWILRERHGWSMPYATVGWCKEDTLECLAYISFPMAMESVVSMAIGNGCAIINALKLGFFVSLAQIFLCFFARLLWKKGVQVGKAGAKLQELGPRWGFMRVIPDWISSSPDPVRGLTGSCRTCGVRIQRSPNKIPPITRPGGTYPSATRWKDRNRIMNKSYVVSIVRLAMKLALTVLLPLLTIIFLLADHICARRIW